MQKLKCNATWLLLSGFLLVAGLGPSCGSSKPGGSPSTGGRPGTGGTTGAGGATSTGGQPGTGGATDRGGATGTGGANGTGGTIGTGGATITGGTTGSGGATGRGGALGTGGATGRGGATGTGGTNVLDAAVDAAPKIGSPCRSDTDCGPSSIFLYCRAPGEPYGCGTCRMGQSTCAGDADCVPDGGGAGAKKICEMAPSSDCYCSAIKLCVLGCRANTDCGTGQGCNAQHACQPTCVPGDGTCATDYVCGTDGFCQQKTCTADSDCSAACVKGKCYGSLGVCQPPAA